MPVTPTTGGARPKTSLTSSDGASTLVVHHPTYFFPDSYSRRIASLIPQCRMAIYSGEKSEFLANLKIAHTFLASR